MDKEKISRFLLDAISFLIYGLLIAVFLRLSWMRWGDLIVDTGKEWYFPAQILSGKVLYRDLIWLYGPLVPYLNALFFRIGGVQIGSLVVSGMVSLVLTVYALHHLAKAVLGALLAVLVVVTFIMVFAFGYYVSPCNYNFIIPYTYASTYGLAFALLGIFFFQKKKETAGKIPGILAVLFLSAALLTRVEVGVMTLTAIVLPTILEFIADKSRGWPHFRVVLTAAFVSGGAAVLVIFIFFEIFLRGETGTWKAVIEHVSHRGTIEGNLSGFNNVGDNLRVWFISCFLYALFTLLFAGAGFAASAIQGPLSLFKRPYSSAVVAIMTLGLTYYIFVSFFGYQAQFRCLPLICLIVGALSARNLYRGQDVDKESLVLTLSLFSFLILLRIFLRVWPGHFGFTLIVPGLIVYYLFFLRMVPSFFPESGMGFFVKGGFVFLSLFFILAYVKTSFNWYSKSTLEVASSRGSLSFFPTEPYLSSKQFLEYLQQNTLSDETLVVFPEGISFNFLADRTNPLTDYIYNPVDLAPEGTSSRVIDQLGRYRVNYVAVLQRDTTEQGFSSFGKDYGADIMGYILKNYDLQKVFGSFPYTSDRFGIALFKRKMNPAADSTR
jgi:hypothetical protein